MSFEIRDLTVDDLEEATILSAQAFGSPHRHDVSEFVEHRRQRFDTDSYLGVFEDGEMTSMMCTIPVQMYLNGGLISLGAVSPVANSPLHCRKGHSGAMLKRSLERMREDGLALSSLYTPHPAFYRRYGWEFASEWRYVRFKPKDLALTVEPGQRGRFRFLDPGDWQELDPVFQAYATSGNGPFKRSESWWRSFVLESPWSPRPDVVLWQNDDGSPQGYAIYEQPANEHSDPDVRVRELVATSRDAWLNLLAYFGRHDIHNEVSLPQAPHFPILSLFADAEKLRIRQGPAVMLRVIDFEAAMLSRPPGDDRDTDEIVVRLLDEAAPWNDGTWRIGVGQGKTWVERTDHDPGITLPAQSLGPLFNGYLSPRSAAGCGLLEADNEDALVSAARIFAVSSPPYFTDQF